MSEAKQTKNNTAVLEGRIVHISEVLIVGQKNSPKRTVVVNTGGDYPQSVPCEFFGKNCDKADRLAVGDEVLISVNLRGRESNGKYYGSLDAWLVKVVSQAVPPPSLTDDIPF